MDMQPSSDAPVGATPPHRGSALPILLVLMILVAIVFGVAAVWLYMNNSTLTDQSQNYVQQLSACGAQYDECQQTLQAGRGNVAFYTVYPDAPGAQPEVRMINGDTGEEATLAKGYTLYAVPQVNYDGRIFALGSVGEGDNPARDVYEIDVETGEVQLTSFSNRLPFVFGATELSPDQTKLVAAYDNILDRQANESDPARTLVVWDLLTGESNTIATLSAGEYFSKENGANAFAGASGYTLSWTDLSCVQAYLYQDNAEDPENMAKDYVRTEAYCLE